MVVAGDPPGAVVKFSPSNAEGVGSNSGGGARFLCLVAIEKKTTTKKTQKPEHKNNRSNNVTNSINFP